MSDAAARIDALMETASQALVETDYLTCERLCTQALQLAREDRDFDRYARILMPLQECRRQRRQIASDHGVAIFTGEQTDEIGAILKTQPTGCVLLTCPPYSQQDAQAIRDAARENEQMVEVLLLDSEALTAAFLKAMEDAGDAIITQSSGDTPLDKLDALASHLDALGDHEIAHQTLAQLARQASRQTNP